MEVRANPGRYNDFSPDLDKGADLVRPVISEDRTRVVAGQALDDDGVSVDDPRLSVTYVHHDNGQFIHSQTEAHIRRSAIRIVHIIHDKNFSTNRAYSLNNIL